jgi:hypothetical protein
VDGLSIENMTQEQIDGENGCLIGPYGTIVILTIMSSDGKKSEVKTSAARKACQQLVMSDPLSAASNE